MQDCKYLDLGPNSHQSFKMPTIHNTFKIYCFKILSISSVISTVLARREMRNTIFGVQRSDAYSFHSCIKNNWFYLSVLTCKSIWSYGHIQ